MIVALNPSPFSNNILELKSKYLDYLILNEIEACQILGLNQEKVSQDISDYSLVKSLIEQMFDRFPYTKIVLTVGEFGSVYFDGDLFIKQDAFKTKVVDTTAAGDTFMGYFIAGMANCMSVKNSMERASKASSIAVSKLGAAQSIPQI